MKGSIDVFLLLSVPVIAKLHPTWKVEDLLVIESTKMLDVWVTLMPSFIEWGGGGGGHCFLSLFSLKTGGVGGGGQTKQPQQ